MPPESRLPGHRPREHLVWFPESEHSTRRSFSSPLWPAVISWHREFLSLSGCIPGSGRWRCGSYRAFTGMHAREIDAHGQAHALPAQIRGRAWRRSGQVCRGPAAGHGGHRGRKPGHPSDRRRRWPTEGDRNRDGLDSFASAAPQRQPQETGPLCRPSGVRVVVVWRPVQSTGATAGGASAGCLVVARVKGRRRPWRRG